MNTDLNSNNGSSNFLNFSDALNHLRWGDRIARRGWKGHIILNYTDRPAPFLACTGGWMPWSPTSAEILAEDWYVLGDHQ
jgi:hypothetical protein